MSAAARRLSNHALRLPIYLLHFLRNASNQWSLLFVYSTTLPGAGSKFAFKLDAATRFVYLSQHSIYFHSRAFIAIVRIPLGRLFISSGGLQLPSARKLAAWQALQQTWKVSFSSPSHFSDLQAIWKRLMCLCSFCLSDMSEALPCVCMYLFLHENISSSNFRYLQSLHPHKIFRVRRIDSRDFHQ